MVKRYLFIFLLVLSFLESIGSVVDSLKYELTKNRKQDTLRVDILNELGYQFWTFDPDQSKEYSSEALELSKSLDYRQGIAFANRSLGVVNWTQGNYEEGLNHLLNALIEYQSLSDTLNIANAMMNTALIYVEQDSYNKAFRYFSEALNTFVLLDKPKRFINTANHIGELFQKQELYDDALNYYRKSLKISDSVNYNYGKATAYLNLGSLYKEMGKLDSALNYSQKAKKIQSASADINGLATTYYTLGTIYFLQSNYLLADENLTEGLRLADQIGSKKLKRDIYWQLSQLKQKVKSYNTALNFLEQYTILNDSLLNAELLKNIIRFENRIELEKKEAEVEKQQYQVTLLEKEARIDKILRYSLIVGFLAALALAYLIWSYQRIKIRKDRELNKSEQELSRMAIENAQLKERDLRQKLEFKNKELTSYTLNFIRKNELLSEVKTGLVELKKSKDDEKPKKLNSLVRLVDSSTNIDRDWSDFKLQFEEVHANFFTALKERYPDLTTNELKLCALLKLNMNLKEAANVLGISPESVKTARYRLRKKLDLGKEHNLAEHIMGIEDSTKP